MIRVLVVDDDFMVARIHERFVERTDGFSIAGTAGTGAEALSAVAELEPDLVLLDVHLPDMDGIEVLRSLRAAGHGVGVIMVTAERDAEVVRAALLGGAQQYLVKPFEYPELADRLRAVARSLTALRSESEPDQTAIDRAFGGGTPGSSPLPKGLSTETAASLLRALENAGEVSAAEAAELVGLSRVSARRYLEHFVHTGHATVRLRYGAAGRPERRYLLG
ncbi:response regulator [Aeromicrobium choanae]|uniref:Transcriptional regulatory protein n=1 Tax=Aeromicrobium choanae TaxID=1736691 RepID=A0A1T4Z3N5_9ACTN|nr:response regulator [Aeromicrobium choanae]SKB08566.1 Response regulator of citrate/malate metabolism [Aeromicrobium choanae]